MTAISIGRPDQHLETSADRRSDSAVALPRIDIICGSSCCGKSVYISRFESNYDEIYFVHKPAERALTSGGRYALHYNLLHPFETPRFRPGRFRSYVKWTAYLARRVIRWRNRFEGDPGLRRILNQRACFHAVILIAPLWLLRSRVSRRDQLEPLTRHGRYRRYRREQWERVYQTVNLRVVMAQWLAFLRRHGITYSFVDASTSDYAPLELEQAIQILLRDAAPGADLARANVEAVTAQQG